MPSHLPLFLLTVSVLLLLAVSAPPVTSQTDDPDAEVFTELDGIRFGEQILGPRISLYDLRGRVVVCYHWCITCPLSTGAFPIVKRLQEKYREKGVAFIGFQVRRSPELRRENVVWFLERLAPNFPVTRRGWVCEWPVRYLPWAVVFNQAGKKVFADNLPGLEAVIRNAVAEGPDYMTGGPYVKLKGLADRIAGDRKHAGTHLASLREILAEKDGDGERRKEAEAMLTCLERYVRRQVARAEVDAVGPVERALVYRDLATTFKGDRLADDARARLKALVSDPGFAGEKEAYDALRRAQARFRRLPKAGYYTYDMDYRRYTDKDLTAKRRMMIAAFRLTLTRITQTRPKTDAASRAGDLLMEHDVPEMGEDEARAWLDEAGKRLREADRPYALYEGFVELYAVVEGYYADDAIAERAARLLETVADERKAALEDAVLTYERLNDEALRTMDAVREGGEILPLATARDCIDRLNRAAEQAGRASRLAHEIARFVAALEKSYEGPASLGTVLERGYPGAGVRVRWINPRSAAHRHGLRPGDVILRFGDRKIEAIADLRDALARRKPGEVVELEIRRDPADAEKPVTLTLSVTLGRKSTSRRSVR